MDTAPPRVTVMDTPGLPWRNPAAVSSSTSTEEVATAVELYLGPMQSQITPTDLAVASPSENWGGNQ